MAVSGKKNPGGGGKRTWHHVSCKGGQNFEGWVAGDAVCVDSHHVGATRPCLKRYFGEEHPCAGCDEPSRVIEQYYLPLYRRLDGRPVVVILQSDQLDMLQALKCHQHVKVGRTEEHRIGMYVSPMLSPSKWTTTLDERKVKADISDWLPILWGMVGVITGDIIRRGPIGNEVEIEPPPIPDKRGKKLSAEETRKRSAEVVGMNFKVKPPTDDVLGDAITETANRMLDRVKRHEANGHH